MDQLLARAVINNGLFVMNACLCLVLTVHLLTSLHRLGFERTYERLGNRAAVAMLIYLSGETWLRGWAGVLLWSYEAGHDPIAIENQYPVALGAAGVCLVGAVCMMRIFSRKAWGHWAWIGSVCLAGAVVIALRLAA